MFFTLFSKLRMKVAMQRKKDFEHLLIINEKLFVHIF